MKKTDNKQPLYLQIAETLRAEVLRLPDGAPIETEQALTERFSVSRGTVRQAVLKLVREGLLTRTRGSGTVRAKQNRTDLTFIVDASSIERIREIGKTSGYRNLSYTTVRATNAIADALRLPHGTAVRRIYRVRTMDDRPLAVGIAYARTDLLKRMPKHPSHVALMDYMQQERQLPHYDRKCTCSAVAATEADAKALGVAPNTPLLQFQLTASIVGVGPFIIDTFRMIPAYSFCMEPYDPEK